MGARARAAVAALVAVMSAAACADRSSPEGPPAAAMPGVVVVVVDALRADHLGAYGYERPTSPRLDEWAARGLLFTHAYTTSPWTLPAFGSLLSGRLPSAHAAGIETSGEDPGDRTETVAARRFVTLSPEVESLAETLRDAGFTTGAFVTNPFLHPRFGLDRGFDEYDHYDSSNVELRRADVVVDEALDWLRGRAGEPFFLLLHLFDPHLDYDAPAPFRGRFSGGSAAADDEPVSGLWPIRNRITEMTATERDRIVAAYDEEIAFVDAELGRLLDGLTALDLLDQGLVVLTSDHGEEFFEHGGFEHGHSMHEEVLRVPLILWGRGVPSGRYAAPVSLIDVAPTILAAVGVEAPGTLPGASLLSAARNAQQTPGAVETPPVVAEVPLYGPDQKAIIQWPHKAIIRLDTGEARLFDLARDPVERTDLAGEQPERLQQMLGELASIVATARATGAIVPAELDEELARRLRALGYIR